MSKDGKTTSHADKNWSGGGYDKRCDDKVCVSSSWSQRESSGNGSGSSSGRFSASRDYPSGSDRDHGGFGGSGSGGSYSGGTIDVVRAKYGSAVLGIGHDTSKSDRLPAQSAQAVKAIDFMNNEAGACWGSNALKHGDSGQGKNDARHVKVLYLAYTGMQDHDLANVAYTLQNFNFEFDSILLQNNNLTDQSIPGLINGITSIAYQTLYNPSNWQPYLGPMKTVQSVVFLNLANNHIGDTGAKTIADALMGGKLHATKSIDVSGNNITESGKSKLTQGMKEAPNTDLNVIFVKAGWKDTKPLWKIAAKYELNTFLQHAKKQGIDTEHVATNNSTLDYILDVFKIGGNIGIGLAKCSNTLLEILSFDTSAPSMVKGFALEMYGTKTMKKVDFRVCAVLEAHDSIVSHEGVELAVKAVELLGDE